MMRNIFSSIDWTSIPHGPAHICIQMCEQRGYHINNHTSESLADCDVSMVQDLGLNLANHCRQSYDNTSNISGKCN